MSVLFNVGLQCMCYYCVPFCALLCVCCNMSMIKPMGSWRDFFGAFWGQGDSPEQT